MQGQPGKSRTWQNEPLQMDQMSNGIGPASQNGHDRAAAPVSNRSSRPGGIAPKHNPWGVRLEIPAFSAAAGTKNATG